MLNIGTLRIFLSECYKTYKMKNIILTFFLFLFITPFTYTQEPEEEEDLLSLLGEEEEETNYVTAAFKTTRVINLHSIENPGSGVLDIKISHRFGFLNGGIYELFGLDASTIRIGGDYGISDNISVGFGRSSFEKTLDAFVKYRILRQSKGKVNMPITASLLATTALKTVKPQNPNRENYFSSRMYYTFQLILGRKFTKSFSFQISPTIVHRNLVATALEKNDVFSIGAASRIKLNNRLAINLEYVYVLPNQLADNFNNSLSIGFDIETGGHVFQLHFTNSTSMIEKGFVAETTGDWREMGVHFGFNISRVFTLVKKNKS